MNGRQGEPGPAGREGEAGQTGVGKPGERGAQGAQGVQGLRGAQGETGLNGTAWLVYAMLAILSVLVVVSFIQVGAVRGFTTDLRNSAIGACERQNEVRVAVRDAYTREIHRTRTTKASFFPAIPPRKFQKLIDAKIVQLQNERSHLPNADCQALYPQP